MADPIFGPLDPRYFQGGRQGGAFDPTFGYSPPWSHPVWGQNNPLMQWGGASQVPQIPFVPLAFGGPNASSTRKFLFSMNGRNYYGVVGGGVEMQDAATGTITPITRSNIGSLSTTNAQPNSQANTGTGEKLFMPTTSYATIAHPPNEAAIRKNTAAMQNQNKPTTPPPPPKPTYNAPIFNADGTRADQYTDARGLVRSKNIYVDFSYNELDRQLGAGFTDQFINRMKVDPIRFYMKAFQDNREAGGYKFTGEPNKWLIGRAAQAAENDARFHPGAVARWIELHGQPTDANPIPPEQWEKWWYMSQNGQYRDENGIPYGVS